MVSTLKDKTEAAYHRTDLFERRRELMDSWSAFAMRETANIGAMRAGGPRAAIVGTTSESSDVTCQRAQIRNGKLD